MSLEKNKERSNGKYEENKKVNRYVKKYEDNKRENRYLKNSIDYSSCDYIEENDDLETGDCLDLLEDYEFENPNHNEKSKKSMDSNNAVNFPRPFIDDDFNELALLGFFNNFTLMDMGIHDFIREVYF